MRWALFALCMALAVPAGAEPEVEQRAFEAIEAGVFVRGGGTSINVGGRCPEGCAEGQRCEQICEDRPCGAAAAPGSACIACDWRCVD